MNPAALIFSMLVLTSTGCAYPHHSSSRYTQVSSGGGYYDQPYYQPYYQPYQYYQQPRERFDFNVIVPAQPRHFDNFPRRHWNHEHHERWEHRRHHGHHGHHGHRGDDD